VRCLRALRLLLIDGVCGVLGVDKRGDVGVGMVRACVADAESGERRIRFGVLLIDVNVVVVSTASSVGALRFAPAEAGSLCAFTDGF
jgi:hypothetical protein